MTENLIAGVDEAGRGPWAGPVIAAAVILPTRLQLDGIKDSKLLSLQKREQAFKLIQQVAHGIGVGWVSAHAIDRVGLTHAVRLAMQKAVHQLNNQFDHAIVDGGYNFLDGFCPSEAIIQADRLHPNVSAASIVAKVLRDRYMHRVALVYPRYGFDKHVGYGTKLHQAALQKFGPTKLHRLSFKPVAHLVAG